MEKKGKVFFYCKEEGVGGGKSKAWWMKGHFGDKNKKKKN